MMLETERLILRPFKDSDRAPIAALNADPEVMRYFPSPLSTEASDAMVDRIEQKRIENGYYLCAAELKSDNAFIGFVGLNDVPHHILETVGGNAEIEIGWRLAAEYWGKGFAPEAAKACLEYSWDTLAAKEIVAFTAQTNLPSQRVMQKIGMSVSTEFDHPSIADKHPLKPHILYRIQNPNLA